MRLFPRNANDDHSTDESDPTDQRLSDIMGAYHLLRNLLHFQLLILQVHHSKFVIISDEAWEYSDTESSSGQYEFQEFLVLDWSWANSCDIFANIWTTEGDFLLLVIVLRWVHSIHLQSLCHRVHIPGSQTFGLHFSVNRLQAKIDQQRKKLFLQKLWLKVVGVHQVHRERIEQTRVQTEHRGLNLSTIALWNLPDNFSVIPLAWFSEHDPSVLNWKNWGRCEEQTTDS